MSEYLRSKHAILRFNNQKSSADTPPPFGTFVLAVLAVQTAKPAPKA